MKGLDYYADPGEFRVHSEQSQMHGIHVQKHPIAAHR